MRLRASGTAEARRRWRRVSRLLFVPAFLLLTSLAAPAQDRPIRIAVDSLPPYAERTADGAWFGLAVDAWRLIAESEGWDYSFVEASGSAFDMLRTGEADLALPVLATPEIAAEFLLTAPVHTATLGVTVESQSMVLGVLRGMMTLAFLELVLGLSLLLLFVGALVWLLERRRNPEQFHERALSGLGDGFWWAGVTLTTIGYGDKTPVTTAGRTVAMLWMLVGLAVSASLTAALVALTGIESGGATLEDLRGDTVAVAADTGTARYLESLGIDVARHDSLQAAVAAFVASDGVIAAVAGPAPALRAAVSLSEAPDTRITDTGAAPSLVTFALADAEAHALIAPAVLDLVTREAGWRLVDDYARSEGGS